MKFRFDQIHKVCISLKRSVKRRELVTEQFKQQGVKFTFFDAIDKTTLTLPEISVKKSESHATGILACAMSHIAVIKMAKELKLPAICIFEDDVIFCEDFKERIQYLEQLPNFDFDILCLGGHFSKNLQADEAEDTQWKHIKKVNKQGGTYGFIITDRVYDFILRNWHYDYGADQFYSTHVYHRFRTYAFVPFLVGVQANESDILGWHWEYENVNWWFKKQAMEEFEKNNNKPDLMDCTFIIPVMIESLDREFNFLRVIQYLCDNFNTHIIIKEADSTSKVSGLLKKINAKGCTIKHLFEENPNLIFHRTRHLNQMISLCRTEIVVNYDIDVLLLPEAYIHARNRIKNEWYDLIYPFKNDPGDGQVQITFPDKTDLTSNLFDPKYHAPYGSKCGHVQFFKTSSYKEGGMENEGFISYAPEDLERMERFIKLGYRVDWSPFQVYHLQHSRGYNSSMENPCFAQNQALYYQLSQLGKNELIQYYKDVEYIKKYKS